MTTGVFTTEDDFGFITSSNVDVGICGAGSDCTLDGTLLTSSELKTEFRSRDFIQKGATGTADQKIMIGKAAGASASTYACFIPLAKSTREKAVADSKVYTVSAADGTRTQTAACDAAAANWVANLCYVCIPE